MDVNLLNSVNPLSPVASNDHLNEANEVRESQSSTKIDLNSDAVAIADSVLQNSQGHKLSTSIKEANNTLANLELVKRDLANQEETLKGLLQDYTTYNNAISNQKTQINGIGDKLEEYNVLRDGSVEKAYDFLSQHFGEFSLAVGNSNDLEGFLKNIAEDGTFSSKSIEEGITGIRGRIEKLQDLSRNITDLQQETQEGIKSKIHAEYEMSPFSTPFRNSDFGKVNTDFTKNDLNSQIGNIVVSQANQINEKSSRFLY
jgi:hypothetical protein